MKKRKNESDIKQNIVLKKRTFEKKDEKKEELKFSFEFSSETPRSWVFKQPGI